MCEYVYMHAKLLQSYQTLYNPIDFSLPGSSAHGILQTRILELVAMPSSRGPSKPRDWTEVSCTVCRFFTSEPPRKPNPKIYFTHNIHNLVRFNMYTLIYHNHNQGNKLISLSQDIPFIYFSSILTMHFPEFYVTEITQYLPSHVSLFPFWNSLIRYLTFSFLDFWLYSFCQIKKFPLFPQEFFHSMTLFFSFVTPVTKN